MIMRVDQRRDDERAAWIGCRPALFDPRDQAAFVVKNGMIDHPTLRAAEQVRGVMAHERGETRVSSRRK